MANWASTSYVIEGSAESLSRIHNAITTVMKIDDNRYEEYKTGERLGFHESELSKYRLGGTIEEEPYFDKGTLTIHAEERWGLQDFHDLLKRKFSDITVYWVVEEQDCDVYATNDKEGKYFPDRFCADCCFDGNYESDYFRTEEAMYKWLSEKTNGRVKTEEDVETFNEDYEDSGAEDENFISIHKFTVMD